MSGINFYAIQLGMNAASFQPEIMNRLKAARAEVIQTSDGLLARTTDSQEQVNDLLSAIDTSLKAQLLEPKALAAKSGTPKDVLAFLAD